MSNTTIQQPTIETVSLPDPVLSEIRDEIVLVMGKFDESGQMIACSVDLHHLSWSKK